MADDDENDDDGASDVDMKDASSSSSRYGVATSADMYGYSHVAVIGRRSFGGCNPTMAEAWQLSQQAEGGYAQQQSVSDKELVKRYLQSRKSADRQKAVGPRHEQYKGKNKKRQKTSLSWWWWDFQRNILADLFNNGRHGSFCKESSIAYSLRHEELSYNSCYENRIY